MDLNNNLVASDEEPTMPTITTSTAAKEATLGRSNVKIDSAYPFISVNSDITNGRKTSALGVLQARLQSTRAIPSFRDDAPDAGETREAEEDASQITARTVPTNTTKSSAPPVSKIVVTTEEESSSIAEEREGVEAAASTTTTTMTTTKPTTLRNGDLLPNDVFWNAVIKAATTKALSEVTEECGALLPNDAFWNASNVALTKALSEVSEKNGSLPPNDTVWSAVNEATTKALSEAHEEYGALLPNDEVWNAVTEETANVLGKMNEEFTKAYEEMSIQVNKFSDSIGEASSTIFGTTCEEEAKMQEESRKISHEQSQALQTVYEEIAINLTEVQRATICEIIEAAKADRNTGSNTTQLNNDGVLGELDGARAVRLADDDYGSTTAAGEIIEVEAKDDDNESATGEFIEVEYSGEPPSSSITEETLPAYPLLSVNSEIPSNKTTSALGVLRAGLQRTRAIPFAKTHKAEEA